MNEQAVRERILELLNERLTGMGLVRSDIKDDMDLITTGVLDSFALMELLAQLEDAYGVQLDHDLLARAEFTSLRGLSRAFTKALAT